MSLIVKNVLMQFYFTSNFRMIALNNKQSYAIIHRKQNITEMMRQIDKENLSS